MQYYRLFFDPDLIGAWFLADVINEHQKILLSSHFTTAVFFDQTPHGKLKVTQSVEGIPVDFRMTYLAIPIVSAALAQVIESVAPDAIQRIPVSIVKENEDVIVAENGYEILNILVKVECVDLVSTHVLRYSELDEPPEKRGQIKALIHLKILPEKAQPHHIFLLEEWIVVAVISEVLKTKIEEQGFTGVLFIPV